MSKKKGYRLGFQYRSQAEKNYMANLQQTIDNPAFSSLEKMMAFSMYVPRQTIATFLYKYELFKKILNVHGNIVECGVGYGGGLMSFAQFSAIFEPINYTRKVIGFDSFDGFPALAQKDAKSKDPHCRIGGMAVDSLEEIKQCARLYDQNRPVGHIPKIELIKGNANETIPQYLKDNPHLVIALLYLDFDLYEPTVTALNCFIQRIPKGGIIAFDELCHPEWPGETLAVLEVIGINNLQIERVAFDSTRSYAVLK